MPPVPTVTQVWELVLLQSINIKISVSTLLYHYLDDVVPAQVDGRCSQLHQGLRASSEGREISKCKQQIDTTYVDAVIVELVLAWVKPPTVPLGHVLQTDGAVIVSVIIRPPILPVRPHVVAHPLMDGLDAHATELPIIAFSQHVDVPLCIGSTQLSVPALQLSE